MYMLSGSMYVFVLTFFFLNGIIFHVYCTDRAYDRDAKIILEK